MKIKVKKNEILWNTISNTTHIPKYIITSDKGNTTYYLYSVDSKGNITKIKQSKSPLMFNDYLNEKIYKME